MASAPHKLVDLIGPVTKEHVNRVAMELHVYGCKSGVCPQGYPWCPALRTLNEYVLNSKRGAGPERFDADLARLLMRMYDDQQRKNAGELFEKVRDRVSFQPAPSRGAAPGAAPGAAAPAAVPAAPTPAAQAAAPAAAAEAPAAPTTVSGAPAAAALWQKKFELLRKYAAGHGGDVNPPLQPREYPGLSVWVANQRAAYANEEKLRAGKPVKGEHRITPSQIEQLASVGFTFLPYIRRKWEEKFQLLQKWTARNGHASPPQSVNGGEYPGLGTWVSTQRTAYNNEQKLRLGLQVKGTARISNEQIAKLETLEFQWDGKAPAARTHRFNAALLQQQPQQQVQPQPQQQVQPQPQQQVQPQPQQQVQPQPQQQVQVQLQPQPQPHVPVSLARQVGGGLDDAAAALLQLRQAAGRQLQQEQPQAQPQEQLQPQEHHQKPPDLDATETEEEETEEEEDSGRSCPEVDGHVAKPQKRPRDDATSATRSRPGTGAGTGTLGRQGVLARDAGGDSRNDDSGIKRAKRLPFLAQSSPDVLQRFDHDAASSAAALELRAGSL